MGGLAVKTSASSPNTEAITGSRAFHERGDGNLGRDQASRRRSRIDEPLWMISALQNQFEEARGWFLNAQCASNHELATLMVAICHNNLGNAAWAG